MRKKKYWKNVFLAFAKSKGRFLSIACLLMIGAMALVGLKATAPNMEQAGQEYVRQSRLADLFVISDYGFSKEDKAELRAVKGAKNEFACFADVAIKNSSQAVRLFSMPTASSQFQLVQGKKPLKKSELALSSNLKGKYRLGQTLELAKANGSQLKRTKFKIVAFVKSGEI